MSDGPHRSLPMRRHWKDTAERAARPVHSSAEVCNALTHALKRDILEAPIEKMRDILNSRKPDLFHILSIDCAIEAVQGGLKGQAAVESTLRNALEETMRSAFRGMNDHYQREATPKETHNLRARLDAARHKLDCGAVANELLSPTKPPSPRSLKLLRHTGLDEGPERP